MTDSEIIGLYNEGRHEEAFSHIVRLYSERLYWHVRRFLCCHEDADDLLQDIFIKVWAALPSFRGGCAAFYMVVQDCDQRGSQLAQKKDPVHHKRMRH